MSDVETDSEGFESADDNEFDVKDVKQKSKTEIKPKEKELKKEEVVDKFKALEVADTNEDEGDDWGWGDDEDDNFKFETKPETSKKSADVVKESSTQSKPTREENSKEFRQLSVEEQSASKAMTPSEPPKVNSWAPWSGVASLISSASSGVASFIESNIGIPDPEELARKQREEKSQNPSEEKADDPAVTARKQEENREKLLNLGSFVSNVTEISNRVISGGLDTLEGIGKKTMTILQENDPGLINKRKLLGLDNDRPVLSQILREAKEKSEESEKNLKLAQRKAYKKQLHFEMLFDDFHGLVHLEALEMLSKQASIKLQSLLMPLTGQALNELQETMSSVTELCEINELDQDETPDSLYEVSELIEKFNAATEDFDIEMDFKDVLDAWQADLDFLRGKEESKEEIGPQDVHDRALKSLAKASALAVNKYHKLAELLLIKEHHSTVNEAECLIQLTNTFCWHLNGIATNFSNKISDCPSNDPEVQSNTLITNIFLESSKSISYIQNAFQLFIPILQIGAV